MPLQIRGLIRTSWLILKDPHERQHMYVERHFRRLMRFERELLSTVLTTINTPHIWNGLVL